MEGKEIMKYSCISFFKKGKCPRAHTSNCPFVIKGIDYSKECIYSKVKLDTKSR